MPTQAKFLIGLLGIGLLTLLWLQPLGQAAKIANDLEQQATQILTDQNADAVTLTVPRRPVSRHIILDGDVPNAERATLREAMLAVPGVAIVTWAQAEPADSAETEQATSEATAASRQCQEALDTVIASDTIQFRSGSPYLNTDARRLLDRMAEAIDGCEGISIEITGHSSAGGREAVNLEMSAFRATTVRDALVERGVPATILTASGKGSSEPLDGNPNDPANRRVTFTVTTSDGGTG